MSPRSDNFGVSKISGSLLSSWLNNSIRILTTKYFQYVTQIDTNHSATINSVVPILKRKKSRSTAETNIIVTAANDNTCQVRDIWDNEMLSLFKEHKTSPFLLTPLDDGVHILSTSYSSQSEMFIWSKENGQLVQNLNPQGVDFDRVESVSQSTNWNGTAYLVFATNSGKLFIYKNQTDSKRDFNLFLFTLIYFNW